MSTVNYSKWDQLEVDDPDDEPSGAPLVCTHPSCNLCRTRHALGNTKMRNQLVFSFHDHDMVWKHMNFRFVELVRLTQLEFLR